MWKHFFRSCISRKSLIPSERSVFRGLLSHPWFRKFENITPGWKSFGQTPKTFTGDKEILARPRKSGLVKILYWDWNHLRGERVYTSTLGQENLRQKDRHSLVSEKTLTKYCFRCCIPGNLRFHQRVRSFLGLVSHPWFSKFANVKKFYRIRS